MAGRRVVRNGAVWTPGGPNDKVQQVLALDPGERHTGMATWTVGNREPCLTREEMKAHVAYGEVKAREVDTEKVMPLYEKIVPKVGVVVIEAYRLYPDKAEAQSYAAMGTSELIGAMRWVAHRAGTPVVMQPAAIKNVTRKQCKARSVPLVHRSVHAQDAMLHLWYFLLREELDGDW